MSDAMQIPQPPHSLKGLVDAPPTAIPWSTIILSICALVVVVLLARWLWRRFGKRAVVAVESAPEVASVVSRLSAQQRLDALAIAQPFAAPAQRAFSYELSHILRLGLSQAAGRDATDKTTEEIEQLLPRIWRWRDELLPQFVQMLRELDAVKFAATPLTSERAAALLADARSWLTRFIPLTTGVSAANVERLP